MNQSRISVTVAIVLAAFVLSAALPLQNGKGKLVDIPGIISADPDWIYDGDDVDFRMEDGSTKSLDFNNVQVGFQLDTSTFYFFEYSAPFFGPRRLKSISRDHNIMPLIGSSTVAPIRNQENQQDQPTRVNDLEDFE